MAAESNVDLDKLQHAIRNTPIIDNHAHNLLRLPALKAADLLSATSEAEGEALQDHISALPHFRAARQLRKLYELPEDADWDAILKKRQELLETDANGLIRKCLEGSYTILVDDGLDGDFEPYNWHDQFTTAPCKRIVRIEAVAADILSALHQQAKLPVGVAIADEEQVELAWATFIAAFEEAITAAIVDKEVVGFKSVICYRTGLSVEVGSDAEVAEAGLRSFRRHFLPHCVQTKFRVQSKGMNDALVISACKLIAEASRSEDITKPIQFHTGLGDNDIDLLDSNPAVMQPLISAFKDVLFVLLHSSYPYTREAGYLAMAYKNVFLDLGEVFPMVSRDGQEQIIRQALEITPTSKLLWSTDGHHFPETYYLANIQGRAVFEKVLCGYVEQGDLSVPQAIQAVEDIFFKNSNYLYSLDLTFPQNGTLAILSSQTVSTPSPPPTTPVAPRALLRALDLTKRHQVKFVFVQWLDYNAQIRSRCLPTSQFEKMIAYGQGRLAISKGNLGTTPNDHMSAAANPVGSIYVEPDLQSFRLLQDSGPIKNAATVMARFTDEEGGALSEFPRAVLGEIAKAFKQDHDIEFLVGFEIEITFCKRNAEDASDPFSPLDTNHAWGTFSDEQYTTSFALMTEIATALENISIPIEQLHSEAGAGQYEFVLPPLPIVEAVDTLIQTRQCIQQIAATRNLRATCHPMPFPGIGTAAHAHISLNSTTADISKISESFISSILTHLPALCAITMPQPISYNRVVDDSWTVGTWVAWGTQNREVPLRRITSNRWEIRCLDGTANMYLALSAILAAGLSGVQQGLPLVMKDCTVNPSKLDEVQREELGIMTRMPRDFEEAITNFDADEELQALLGSEMSRIWRELKRAEQGMFDEKSEGDRRKWLIEIY
ncbi:Protein fluG [Pseudocercospora fuligena]|uniref:Glutamine synthetase n=1 Tax=Pseudocercospora fuligena TaxID=685502 RepID=A0A8H6RN96_9PEZI|nr:Protein fluG [Pseudocercospora fuligena]